MDLLKLVPSDQLKNVKKAAYELYLKNLETRPEVSKSYLHTAQIVNDRIVAGNIESIPLSESEALKIVKELQNDKFSNSEYGLTLDSFIEWSDIAKVSGEAALTAAITSVALQTAPDILKYIHKLLANEEIAIDDIRITGGKFIQGSIEGSLRGGIAAFILIACRSGKLGPALVGVNPSIVGVATAITIQTIKNTFMVFSGDISFYDFAMNNMRDSLMLGLSFGGLTLGQILIPVPILGAVIGSIVGSTLGTVLFTGAKSFILEPLLISGHSFFGLVKQDYTLPDAVLQEAGLETIELIEIDLETIELETIDLEEIELESIGFTVLERGFIKVNTIGYLTM